MHPRAALQPAGLLLLPLLQEYFACAPAEEREAADALMEQEFCRLAHMNVGPIDDAFKQVRCLSADYVKAALLGAV